VSDPVTHPPGEEPKEAARQPIARWRLWVAVGVVVALAVALAALALDPPGPSATEAPPTPTSPSPAPPTSGPSPRPSTSTSSPAGPATPTAAALTSTTRQALRAWAAFASSGDLRSVRPHFWPDGPQYQQFQREASQRGLAGGPFRYELTRPTVRLGPSPVVQGTVTVSQPAGRSAQFTWDFWLRYDPGSRRWRVWAVTQAPTTTTRAGG
jgi:hypothetical protein